MSAIPTYKDIIDLIKKGATIEAQEQIMALREAAMNLQDENHMLRETLKGLEAALAFKDGLQFVAPFYFKEGDGHPFCSRCWEKDRAGIHVGPRITKGYVHVRVCPQCKSDYYIGDVDLRPISI